MIVERDDHAGNTGNPAANLKRTPHGILEASPVPMWKEKLRRRGQARAPCTFAPAHRPFQAAPCRYRAQAGMFFDDERLLGRRIMPDPGQRRHGGLPCGVDDGIADRVEFAFARRLGGIGALLT